MISRPTQFEFDGLVDASQDFPESGQVWCVMMEGTSRTFEVLYFEDLTSADNFIITSSVRLPEPQCRRLTLAAFCYLAVILTGSDDESDRNL